MCDISFQLCLPASNCKVTFDDGVSTLPCVLFKVNGVLQRHLL